ncbi:MAG: ribokinase [Planctomycetota bacterium]
MSGLVCVLGSINMDLVVQAPDFPRPGVTQLGATFATHPGGKGASQAIAASRLGAEAQLIGAVGDDEWGKDLRACLASEGVDIEHVARIPSVASGVGFVTVVEGGESGILVAPGANHALTAEHIDAAHADIAEADVLFLQNEVPAEVSLRAAEVAAAAGKKVVFNPAPAGDVPAELLEHVHLLVANRAEARMLSGCEEDVSAAGIARRISARGPKLVAVTLGAEGALLFDGETVLREPAPEVETVDTVGAGDAFIAALGLSLATGTRMADSLRFACAAASLATTVEGAIPSLPNRADVEALLGVGDGEDG